MRARDNFTGMRVNGYDAPECVLVRQAAEALKAVQADVKAKGLTLKVYDCYRPARAVAAFVAWAKLPDDPKAKATYYPTLAKGALFPDYIATRSGHSRGATLDLTLVPIDAAGQCRRAASRPPCLHGAAEGPRALTASLAMGTSFDCFDVKANTAGARPRAGGAGRIASCWSTAMQAPRLQELPQGMVALHARDRALSRHDLRFSDRAAASRVAALFVAVDALAPLVALLRFDAQGRDRPRVEALQADRFARLLAIAVGAVVEPDKGGVDLGDQLALAVAGPKLERALGLGGRPVGDIGVLRRIRRANAGASPWSNAGSRRASRAACGGNRRAGARS